MDTIIRTNKKYILEKKRLKDQKIKSGPNHIHYMILLYNSSDLFISQSNSDYPLHRIEQ